MISKRFLPSDVCPSHEATLKADKMIDTWSHDVAAPSILQAGMSEIMGPSLPGFIPSAVKNWLIDGAGLALNVFDDPTSVQGAADLAYTVAAKKINYRKLNRHFLLVSGARLATQPMVLLLKVLLMNWLKEQEPIL